jgi:hypothetical protein
MRRLILTLGLLGLAACGGGAAAPTPPPLPPAAVVAVGPSQWVNCLPVVQLCTFQAEIKNVGSGCASDVRGTTRFETTGGAVLGSFNWTTGGGVMRSNETFVYAIPNVPVNIWSIPTQFVTQPSWTDVRCP